MHRRVSRVNGCHQCQAALHDLGGIIAIEDQPKFVCRDDCIKISTVGHVVGDHANPGNIYLLVQRIGKEGTFCSVTDMACPSSTSTRALTRPAGVSNEMSVTGSDTSTMPVSTSALATAIVACPHMGRHPVTSMKITPH